MEVLTCTIMEVLSRTIKKVLTCMQEAGTGFASKPQTDDAEPGDIALDSWVRYHHQASGEGDPLVTQSSGKATRSPVAQPLRIGLNQ